MPGNLLVIFTLILYAVVVGVSPIYFIFKFIRKISLKASMKIVVVVVYLLVVAGLLTIGALSIISYVFLSLFLASALASRISPRWAVFLG